MESENSHLPLSQAELVAGRLAGRLPHIDICGTNFTIDLRLQELRETESPWNRLDISELETSMECDCLLFFYDTKRHRIYELDDDLTELPENVVLVELLDEMTLDPVAAARSVGYSDDRFLDEYPIQENLKAGIKQLSETFLPDFAREKLEKQNNRRPAGR